MKKQAIFLAFLSFITTQIFAQQPLPPDKLYGQLFTDVQTAKIFEDGKTFVDCVPKRAAAAIVADYQVHKNNNGDLKTFVLANFTLPITPSVVIDPTKKTTAAHINELWQVLGRPADAKVEGSSLLPLPFPYIVPGGRFREIYYWDSYFTMLGLKESGKADVIENMVDNFAFLINTYGHIPNGNRTYYLSRSQPPFFSLMVSLLASIKGDNIFVKYLPALQKEYDYWTDKTAATQHQVTMPDGSVLSRYYDRDDIPRQESYAEDLATSNNNAALNRNLRSGAESGWDFSSRWFADNMHINTIEINDMIPVDLNSLLYNLELALYKANCLAANMEGAVKYSNAAEQRKAAIQKYCWYKKGGYYADYNFKTATIKNNITAATLYPLFLRVATAPQAKSIASITEKYLLKPGGLVTTVNNTGQQWDAPNGWAPLQWVAVTGLAEYGHKALAQKIATRWLTLNDNVYNTTGKLMEKYNVEDLSKPAGGGEYPSQDGFGWTNGVYLALDKLYR